MLQAIIGIPCDIKMVGLLPFHAVGEKYIAAAAGGAGGVPVLLPALGDKTALREVLELVDGVLLPGSPSMSSRIITAARPAGREPCTTRCATPPRCR